MVNFEIKTKQTPPPFYLVLIALAHAARADGHGHVVGGEVGDQPLGAGQQADADAADVELAGDVPLEAGEHLADEGRRGAGQAEVLDDHRGAVAQVEADRFGAEGLVDAARLAVLSGENVVQRLVDELLRVDQRSVKVEDDVGDVRESGGDDVGC